MILQMDQVGKVTASHKHGTTPTIPPRLLINVTVTSSLTYPIYRENVVYNDCTLWYLRTTFNPMAIQTRPRFLTEDIKMKY